MSVEFLPPAKEKVLNGCIVDETLNISIIQYIEFHELLSVDVLQGISVH